MCTGPLDQEVVIDCLNDVLEALLPVRGASLCDDGTTIIHIQELQELPEAVGTLIVRADVASDGTVAPSAVRFLTDTLVLRPWSEGDPGTLRSAIKDAVIKHVTAYTFPQCSGTTKVTFPLVF